MFPICLPTHGLRHGLLSAAPPGLLMFPICLPTHGLRHGLLSAAPPGLPAQRPSEGMSCVQVEQNSARFRSMRSTPLEALITQV